ncbi:nucleoside monophosphate kinase [Candidatus Woesearchaeota archaeon]|nr:nucleoside monophosphate kinase [Candidatus Woesearchaeota archaeon]
MNIILLGPQGSGKGTQADLLAKHFGLKHLSTGHLYRQALAKKEQAALKIKTYADKGELAPDKLIIQLIKNHISDANIFDGFPRTLEQAEALDELINIDFVIELSLSDTEAVRRISHRLECHNCGAIFGAEKQPKQKGTCDVCGSKIEQRADDKPEAIKKRIERYHEETEPLLEYYRPRKIVHKINAAKNVFDVFTDLKILIEKHSAL